MGLGIIGRKTLLLGVRYLHHRMLLGLLRTSGMYEAVPKLVPEIDSCNGVVDFPDVVDGTEKGLELFLLGLLDLGHTILGNVVADNVLDE